LGKQLILFLEKFWCHLLTAFRVIGVIGALIFALALGIYYFYTSSTDEEVYRLPSPDGELNAIVLRETRRFTGKTMYHLYIVEKGYSLSTIDYQKVYRYHYYSAPEIRLKNLIWVGNRLLQLGRFEADLIEHFTPKGFICHFNLDTHHKALVELATISEDGHNKPMVRVQSTSTVIKAEESSW
jgi:hypothetical protein